MNLEERIKAMSLEELEERKSQIVNDMDNEGADLDALKEEMELINARKAELEAKATADKKAAEARKVAEGAGNIVKPNVIPATERKAVDEREKRAKKFMETGTLNIDAEETRSILVSSGDIATPTQVGTLKDMVGGANTSILDVIYVENCKGMGKHRVPYVDAEPDAASEQTEGGEAVTAEGAFGYVDITPTSIAAYSEISKQVRQQSPVLYEAKVEAQAMKSLRKKAVALVAAQLKASELTQALEATLDSDNKGVINEKTLRNIAFAYGGSDEIDGGAELWLNKKDLIAFGDVRGTNEKKAVYEITPDGSNPNVGTIADGGLSVKYRIVNGLTACQGTAQGEDAIPTMFYGNPLNFELDLFSNYEINVSEEAAFKKLMLAILGDAELGGDVIVKNGFVAYTISPSA